VNVNIFHAIQYRTAMILTACFVFARYIH